MVCSNTTYGCKGCVSLWTERWGRRKAEGYLSLASVATGHSLVVPCGLGNSTEAGGGAETPSQSLTGSKCGCWEEKMARLWEGFYHWDVWGGCQCSSTCAHVNRTEGGVLLQARPAITQLHQQSHSLILKPASTEAAHALFYLPVPSNLQTWLMTIIVTETQRSKM